MILHCRLPWIGGVLQLGHPVTSTLPDQSVSVWLSLCERVSESAAVVFRYCSTVVYLFALAKL